ncbi:MAG TPA: DPP IV N-terminal domain-containing protein [Longimicrobiales bacterium]|nr:DPP IV N-terminal domain-containing protein [Longimicrobiales bacterium]
MRSMIALATAGTALLCAVSATAQQPHAPTALTADDYARAEAALSAATTPLVTGLRVDPVWLPDGRFWYRSDAGDAQRVVLVDPARGTRAEAFEHPRLLAALAAAADTSLAELPLRAAELAEDTRSVAFQVGAGRFRCDIVSYRCAPEEAIGGPGRTVVVSPDGRLGAFVREHDLWVRELASGRETRLTHDGQEHFGYATNNAGWVRSDRPVVTWSPDSRRIATFQHDARGVGDMALVSSEVGQPRIDVWRYPLPGDSVIFRIQRVIIDLEAAGGPQVVRLRMPPDDHRSTVCDHVVCGGEWADIQWYEDGSKLAFVSSSRDHKRATLRIADAATGAVRDVLEETVPTFYESGYRTANWRVLPERGEVLWYSRRDDWGHLYLYDLATGALKRQVTSGDWNVLQLLHVGDDGALTFTGNEREPGDPYFHYLYRADLDGGGPTLLTPDSAHHAVDLSPDGRWVVDTRATPTTPPVHTLRDARTGRQVMELERADAARLFASGWQPPEPIVVKARDGVTELHGLLYRPTWLDPTKKYPIINHIYPGPQSGSVGTRGFTPARGDAQAIAELGFVVVQIDAMGTPQRSRTFHEAYFGDMGDNGLPDQVAGMRQLAERHAWIDLERAGIYGHSGGGFASTGAILRYPDFFKVAVSQAGNHDNRNYEDDWGEKWQGLLERYPDGSTNYDDQANQNHAANLKGKLLLAHGTLDDNVPASNTLLVVDALIAANKDFDLILFPNRRHGFGNEPYMVRRRWDYFVQHLLGAEPPVAYEIGARRPTR